MWETFKEWWQAIVDFFYRLLLSVFDFFKDFLWFVLDNLIAAGISVLELLEGSAY